MSTALSDVHKDTLVFLKSYEGMLTSPKKDVSKCTDMYIIGLSTEVNYAKSKGWDGKTMTEAEAMRVAGEKIKDNEKVLSKIIPSLLKYPKGVLVAVHSAYYNTPNLIGPKMVKFLNKGDVDKASRELAWGHNPREFKGLIVRRFAEANLMRSASGLSPLTQPASVQEFYREKSINYPVM